MGPSSGPEGTSTPPPGSTACGSPTGGATGRPGCRGDVAGARRRGYTCLFFDAPGAAEAERRLAGLLRELASELAAGNRVESCERYYDRYFEVRSGRPVGRDAAIAAATARVGYFALFSNEAMGPFVALAIYRDKDAIERRLGDAGSLLGFRAPPASAEDTLAGRLFVTFVALVLAAWLRRRMRETGLDGDHTLESLLDEVEAIERYAREGHRPRVLGVTPRQEAVFERLGYCVQQALATGIPSPTDRSSRLRRPPLHASPTMIDPVGRTGSPRLPREGKT